MKKLTVLVLAAVTLGTLAGMTADPCWVAHCRSKVWYPTVVNCLNCVAGWCGPLPTDLKTSRFLTFWCSIRLYEN